MTTQKNELTFKGRALISDLYVQQNAQLHREHHNFGGESYRWVDAALRIIREHDCRSLLDYGCGKGTFRTRLGEKLKDQMARYTLQEYDPAIPGKNELPDAADFVLCNDVLEHIEPDMVEAVLDHLQSLVLKAGLIGIATKPAVIHRLPDGRNPHLSVHPDEWWEERLKARFRVKQIPKSPNRVHEYACEVTPL